jgi:multimeric flavodoxin WrbA
MASTIALFASSRRHGNTGAILDRIAAAAEVEVVDLAEVAISPYDYSHGNRTDGFERLIDKVLGYKQVIFAAPVYWYSVPPHMKTFIDRLTDLLEVPDLKDKGRKLREKHAFVVATSGIDELSYAYISMFKDTFAYLGMAYCGVLHVNCEGGYKMGTGEGDIQSFISVLKRGA